MKLHSRSCGKTVHSVWKCDTFLEIRYTDGTSLKIGWRDTHGNLVHGEPDLLFEGTHIRAQPVKLALNELVS